MTSKWYIVSSEKKGTSRMFTPSVYQEDIFRVVEEGSTPSLMINACPGSGKTTTIAEIIKRIPYPNSCIALAFNSNAAKDLNATITERLADVEDAPTVKCTTLHSYGLSMLYKVAQDIGVTIPKDLKDNSCTFKYRNIIKEEIASYNKTPIDESYISVLKDLIDKARVALCNLPGYTQIDEEWVLNKANYDALDEEEGVCTALVQIMKSIMNKGILAFVTQGQIDFTDMLWIPAVLSLKRIVHPDTRQPCIVRAKKYDVVGLDESQDMSPAQMFIALLARKEEGLFVAVGDRHQSVNLWNGAAETAISDIIAATKAVEMPLPICYRCPKSAVKLALAICPDGMIESPEDMPEGAVIRIRNRQIIDIARKHEGTKTLIVSRTKAPLVKLYLQMVREGIRCTLKGRDIGAELLTLFKSVEKQGTLTRANFITQVSEYSMAHCAVLAQNIEKNHMRISAFMDKVETLEALYESYKGMSLEGFQYHIESFFSKDTHANIVLMSIHASKGSEYPVVIIHGFDQIPHPMAITPEEIEQEVNLLYVAVTRVKHSKSVPSSGVLYIATKEVSS